MSEDESEASSKERQDSKPGTGISRKNFLKLGAAAIVTGVASKASRDPRVKAIRGLTKEPESKEELILNENGVRVWVDNQGVPTRWEDKEGAGEFDREKLISANEEALKKGEEQFAGVVRVNRNTWRNQELVNQDKEGAGEGELPEEVLSKEELARRGISIYDSQNVGFHIQRWAFEDGGVLKNYSEESPRKLSVVIVDSPTLTAEAFGDERYDPIRESIEELIDSTSDLRSWRSFSYGGHTEQENKKNMQLVEQVTDEEFQQWGLVGIPGYSTAAGFVEGTGGIDYLFLSIGEQKERPEIEYINITAHSQTNKFEVDYQRDSFDELVVDELPRVLTLDRSQSFTDPSEYVRIESHGEGTFQWKVLAGVETETKDPYFVALHEAEHLRRLAELAKLEEEPEGVERLRYFSEQEVDWATLGYITDAYNHYKETGDASRYPLVLEDKRDGNLIIG